VRPVSGYTAYTPDGAEGSNKSHHIFVIDHRFVNDAQCVNTEQYAKRSALREAKQSVPFRLGTPALPPDARATS